MNSRNVSLCALFLAFFSAVGCTTPPLDRYQPPPGNPWLERVTKVDETLRRQLCESQRSFLGVGDLPGGEFASGASAVSRDGTRVVGKSVSDLAAGEAFGWTRPGSGINFWPSSSSAGLIALGCYVPPGGAPGIESEALSVSADGKVVVGSSKTADTIWRAVKWTEQGIELVPGPSGTWGGRSSASGVSADGGVIVGVGAVQAGEFAFRWSSASETESLTQPPAGSVCDHSWANNVSDDGTTIVGWMLLDGSDRSTACVWKSSSAGGPLTLHTLSGLNANAFNVSADGSVAVGYVGNDQDFDIEACWWQWDAAQGVWSAPGLLGKLTGMSGSWAFDVDAESRAIVGYSYDYATATDLGTLWFLPGAIHSQGPHDVSYFLTQTGLTAHQSWVLTIVTGVTHDPTTKSMFLVGGGNNAAGQGEGWIARIPPWCIPLRRKLEPNVPYLFPLPFRTIRGGPIDPLGKLP